MTFLQLQKEVARRLGLDFANLEYHTLQQIKDAVNEGYECISEASEWYEVSQSISWTTGIYYDLKTLCTKPFLRVLRMFNNATNWWLPVTTVRQMDEQDRRWELAAGGSPEKIFLRGSWWLGTYPHLDSASGTATLKHSAIPDAMSADGDTPGMPATFHKYIADYATYDLLCAEHEFARSMRYWQSYMVGEVLLVDWVQARVRLDRVGGMNSGPEEYQHRG